MLELLYEGDVSITLSYLTMHLIVYITYNLYKNCFSNVYQYMLSYSH